MMYLHTHPRSPFCVKAEWALLEMGLSYNRNLLEFGNAEGWAKVVADAKGGPATIPMLVDGEFSLTESSAIVFYAADKNNLNLPFVSKDPAARARIVQWDRLADFEALNIGMAYFQNTPERLAKSGSEANQIDLNKAKEKFDKLSTTMETVLSQQKYLASATDFTYADVAMACYFMMIARSGGPQLTTPAAKTWFAEASARPAYTKLMS